MQEIIILEKLLLVNTIFSVLFFIIMVLKKKWRKGLVFTLFFLFCPIIGYFMMLFAMLFYYLFLKWTKEGIDISELSFNKERMKIVTQPNVTKETNLIPLEEALVVTGKNEMRNVFLDVLKLESEESLNAIRNAVEHEDSEIAHYAASYISDTIAKFKENEYQLEQKCIEENEVDQMYIYVEYVISFLRHGLLTDTEQCSYVLKAEDKLERLMQYDNSKLNITSGNISDIVWILQDLKENNRARKWVNIGLDLFKNNLESYKTGLKYYYSTGLYNEFFDLFNELKESSLIFDDEMLDMVRYFE